MGRSLSLAAYRAYSRRKSLPVASPSAARPEGEVLWMHATSGPRLSALRDLGKRLQYLRPGLKLLLTAEKGRVAPFPPRRQTCEFVETLGSDHPGTAQQFLSHWAPDMCLWSGGALMPNLIGATADQGIAMVLLDAGEADFPTRHRKWFPDLTRASLTKFDTILTNGRSATALMQRIGVPRAKIETTTQLRNSATPQPWPEPELAAVTDNLAGRPVWLAAFAQPPEFAPILNAHRIALRLVHRLLLVIIAEHAEDAQHLETQLTGFGLRHIRWNIGDTIEDNTQILIAQGGGDPGMWYRVAPLTFMAGSLPPDATGRSPLEATALGSAILYGPNVCNHHDDFARLDAAGAARMVPDSAELGAAVIQLMAPDQAAAMALAGWEIVTEAAELTDKLIDLVQDMLDLREATHAPA
jgi:3-deoxy-D-manno-octulosonic-acid transferase